MTNVMTAQTIRNAAKDPKKTPDGRFNAFNNTWMHEWCMQLLAAFLISHPAPQRIVKALYVRLTFCLCCNIDWTLSHA
jgi:hypothetical protein